MEDNDYENKSYDTSKEEENEYSPEESKEVKEIKTESKINEEDNSKYEFKLNKWQIASLILGLLLIISIFSYGLRFNKPAQVTGAVVGNALSGNDAADKAVKFINENLLQQGTASVKSVEEKYGLYSVKLNVNGRDFDSYITKDGSLLFPSAVDLNVVPEKPEFPEAEEIPKKDKVEVKLFVMSQCPFGVIAEKSIAPVFDLIGDKIDFQLNFIANDNNGVFSSLHGDEEVEEDLRQLCAAKKYPDNYFEYILCVDKDASNADKNWENCAKESLIDTKVIKECSEGEEGKKLLSESIAVSNKYDVSGSPTLFINDASYNGARTPEAFKTAICSGFNVEPEKCKEQLSITSEAPTGSCG